MNKRSLPIWIVLIGLVVLVGSAVATWDRWLAWVRVSTVVSDGEAEAVKEDDHGHDHADHSEESSIKLSPSALKNIGYQPITVTKQDFQKSLTVPAMVVERPGRSQLHITAPLTGIITKIFPIEGVAVDSGDPLFEIRLTHEDLVAAQRDFLRTVESLAVVEREIKRLQSLADGVVAGKRVVEQEYEKHKLEASLKAEQQALLLHGLTAQQVDTIVTKRELLPTLTINAPEHAEHEQGTCAEVHLFHVQSLPVTVGQQVNAGDQLCVLADHCQLFLEGRAFADDASRLREATMEGWDISARMLVGHRETETVHGLKLLYVADHIDSVTRAFRFYVSLPNQVVLDKQSSAKHRFLEWRFKPGQRMELRVPVEQWKDQIVLPAAAIVEEGVEKYVYVQNGTHFDRTAVHVLYSDQSFVVIGDDGILFPGDVVAATGVYQMHLALKNKAGGGIDPHAGHNH